MIYKHRDRVARPKFLVGTAKNVTDRIWARLAFDMVAPERQLLLTPVGAHMFLTETARSFVVGAQTSVGLPPEVAFTKKIDRVFGSHDSWRPGWGPILRVRAKSSRWPTQLGRKPKCGAAPVA